MSNSVVIDTSLAVKWVIHESDSPSAFALLRNWGTNDTILYAPDLLLYEISNVLYQNMQRNKYTVQQARDVLDEIATFKITFIPSNTGYLGKRALEFADQYGLPASYDAYYLALAERETCELWTADTKLWRAVQGKIDWVRNLQDYKVRVDKEKTEFL